MESSLILQVLFSSTLFLFSNCWTSAHETPLLTALDKNLASQSPSSIEDAYHANTSDINFKTNEGASPLHIAVAHDNLWAVEFLLLQGANPNSIQTRIDRTPLQLAGERGNVEITRALLANGAYVHSGAFGWTPLHLAAHQGHLGVVGALVAAGSSVHRPNERAALPHHLATSSGHLPVLKFFVEKGANLSAQTTSKETALDLAAANGHEDIVEYLVEEKRLDVNKPVRLLNLTTSGFSYTWANFGSLSPNFVGSYSSRERYGSDSKTPLMLAAGAGHSRIAQLLLAHGAGVNIISKTGSALSLAAYGRHWDLVAMLLQAGADPNLDVLVTGASGWDSYVYQTRLSPLELAIDSRNSSNVKLLGPASNSQVKAKAFVHALGSSSLDMVQILVRNGAAAGGGPSPYSDTKGLLLAAASNRNIKSGLEISKWLLSTNKNINAEEKNKDGHTALQTAIYRSNWDLVRLLVTEHGANVNVAGELTPLFLAAMRNSSETVKLLLDHGADVNAGSRYGGLPILKAAGLFVSRNEVAANATLDIVKLLTKAGALQNLTVLEAALLEAAKGGMEPVASYLLDVATATTRTQWQNLGSLLQKLAVYAAERGFVTLLQKLKSHGARLHDVDVRSYNNYTLLQGAASRNRTKVVKFLVRDAPATVNRKSEYMEETPLHSAAREANLELAQFLVQHGGSVNVQNKIGKTPLSHALNFDSWGISEWEIGTRLQIIDYLLEAGADPTIELRNGEKSLLHLMAESFNARVDSKIEGNNNFKKMVRQLVAKFVAKGLQVDHVNRKGDGDETALARAAAKGSLIMAEALLDAGANVHAVDGSGLAVLHKAAVGTPNPKLFSRLLYSGARTDVNSVDMANGETPLTLLSGSTEQYPNSTTHLSMVQDLVRAGANVNHRTRKGETSLTKLASRATREDTFETVRFLVEQAGARVGWEAVYKFGSYLGRRDLNWNIIQYLVTQIQKRGQPGVQNSATLMQAAKAGEWDTVRFLVNQGADVGQQESEQDRSTALHYAVQHRGNLPIVKLLVEHGSRKYIQSKGGYRGDGKTPLELAKALQPEPDQDVLMYLISQ